MNALGLAQPSRVVGYRVEHRLQIARRGADDLQDVCGRGLPLQRLLRLVEEPDVLDRDHGLIREGLDELYLFLIERADVRAA